jgi:hypothetical protein
MISPDLIEIFDEVVGDFNSKQQSIAEELLFNKTYYIIKVKDNNQYKLALKNRHTEEIFDFVEYVKSKCNC